MSDISRAWKKVKREVKRAYGDVEREVKRTYEKIGEEVSRPEFYQPVAAFAIGGGAGVGVYYGGKYLKGMMPEMPPIPPMPPPGPSSVRVQAAGAREREARRKRRGYGSTMLTGQLGVATTYRKQILG